MRRFELLEPDSLAAASAALAADPEAKAIAGGTALLILIKHGVFVPGTLVNLRKIDGAAGITFDPERGLRIGALTSIFDVERDPAVRRHYPVLAEACHVVANIRIRNLATIGGNLAHADYQSDPPTALAALGAEVEVTGPDGTRVIALTDLVVGAYETVLDPAELISAILLPPAEPDWVGTYLKFTTRSSEDRPAVGIAALVRRDGDRCIDARFVVGAVTTTPTRISRAEELATGRAMDRDLFAAVGEAVAAGIAPIDDVRGSAAYKRRVAGVLAERALERCFADVVIR